MYIDGLILRFGHLLGLVLSYRAMEMRFFLSYLEHKGKRTTKNLAKKLISKVLEKMLLI